MKYFLITTFFLSLTAMASNWVPQSVINNNQLSGYSLQSDCEKTGQSCFDVGDSPEMVSLGFVSVKENYLKSDEQECSDDSDCSTKFIALVCTDNTYTKIKNLDLLQVYCTKLASKVLVKDQLGYATYLQNNLASAQFEAGIKFAKSLRECGGRVMDLLLVRNQPKGLTTSQVKQLVSAYSSIQGLLISGSLTSAKEEISNVVADGIVVTESDKAALIKEIDNCQN